MKNVPFDPFFMCVCEHWGGGGVQLCFCGWEWGEVFILHDMFMIYT